MSDWRKEPMGDFRDFYHHNQLLKVNSLWDLFVAAWSAYHEAADDIDGHIRSPHTREEHRLCNKAALAGARAQKRVLEEAHYDSVQLLHDATANQIWHQAKLEALRKLGK